MVKLLCVLSLICSISCNNKQATILNTPNAGSELFYYQGRIAILNDNTVALISPGAYVASNFSGNYCEVFLKGEQLPYNYVSIELDGKYLGRIKIESDATNSYIIDVPNTNEIHTIKIFKESEASNGTIIFSGLKVEKMEMYVPTPSKYIEFIGDSITCGAAADGSVTPCDDGQYFDHQNVYFSYGLSVSRALNTNVMLSSVSGIGIYRNWNDENIEEPIMQQVYENRYLNMDNSNKFNFENIPDIVSICLGTNDMSGGDGVKPRLPFNKEKYVNNYINFVKTINSYYPETQIVLLNSPMIVGEANDLLVSCLREIKSYFGKKNNQSILIFEFDSLYVGGCSWHPSVEEHQEMAEKLIPFFESILY